MKTDEENTVGRRSEDGGEKFRVEIGAMRQAGQVVR